MRRIFASLLTACCAFHAVHPTAMAVFPDIGFNSPFRPAFEYLNDVDIVHGFPDGTGRPQALLTRVEALKTILYAEPDGRFDEQIEWFEENLPDLPLFADTDYAQWYAPFLEVAFLEGVVTGYPDGLFRPANSLTVAEALAMLERAFGTEETAPYRESPTLPNNPNQWYTTAVNTAIDRNLVMRGTSLQLDQRITRGQFFDILYRYHDVTSRNIYAYDGEEPLSVITQSPGIPVSNSPLPSTVTGPGLTNDAFADSAIPSASLPFASDQHFAITIPDLDIYDFTITHPHDLSHDGLVSVLENGLGHLFSYPGNQGTVMIYGHSSSYAWDTSKYTRALRQINKLQPGQRIYLTYNGKLFVYEVTHHAIIDAADASFATEDVPGERLALYTCWPPDDISHRYVMFASPIETVALNTQGPSIHSVQ